MSSRTLRRVLSIVILIALLIPPVPVGAAEPDASPPQPAVAQEPVAQAPAVDGRPVRPPAVSGPTSTAITSSTSSTLSPSPKAGTAAWAMVVLCPSTTWTATTGSASPTS